MAKITKTMVDALQPGDVVWQQNFGVRGNADGTKSFLLDYRVGRRRRRLTIGTYGAPWTVDLARKRANELLRDILADGADPLAAKVTVRDAPTVRDLVERFLTEHVATKTKPRTAALYRAQLRTIVVPALGTLAVRDVTRADVAALHHRLRPTPVHANRVLLVISKMMNVAERWGLRDDGSNPCRHVERYREEARARYLSRAEFRRLGQALVAAERGPVSPRPGHAAVEVSPLAIATVKLLVFTGCRRDEILSLQWAHVDLEGGLLRLPTSKTGPKLVMLNAPALAVLASLPRIEGNKYVLPGVRKGQHLVNISKPWYSVRALAKLDDVRLHDLRHSLASVGAGAGLSLPIIGGLLGHTQAQTTKRYAHLANTPLKQAAELVGQQILAAMGTR